MQGRFGLGEAVDAGAARWVVAALLLSACSAGVSRTPAEVDAGIDLALAFSCDPPNLDCGGACINPSTDTSNCGKCGNACTIGQMCTDGFCGCRPGVTDCGNGVCTDLQTDPLNCGECGLACRTGEPYNETCIGGDCRTPCDADAAGNEGCSFFPVNLWSTANVGEFGVVAANTSATDPAMVTLSDSQGKIIDRKTAPPGGLAVFRLPQDQNKLTMTEQSVKAFHLTASRPVVAYQFHPIDAALVYTGSSTLLLPEYAMGRDYYAMSYTYNAGINTSPPQGQGYLAVIAMEDDTLVTVTVPVATMGGGPIAALAAKGKVTRTLKHAEVLEITQANSLEDISGARVHASKRVMVFGGAGTVTVPDTASGGDHIEVAMFPLSTWGKHFVASKMQPRTLDDRDHYRILASRNGTHVTLTGPKGLPKLAALDAGHFVEFDTPSDFEIVADQPIFVMQYLEAWGALNGIKLPAVTTLGDANATSIIPVEQYAKRYVFYVPETYPDNFITVTADLSGKDPVQITLDGKPVAAPLLKVGTGSYGRVILGLMPGPHLIEANAAMELLVYGYSNYISYSYVGGGHLDIINPNPPVQ